MGGSGIFGGVSEFFDRCYEVVRLVPRGRVMTYADVAFAAGRPGAARAVGTAMRLNPDIPATPCHRIVPSDGRVGKYSGPEGVARKVRLLQREGVEVRKGRIVDFGRRRWRLVPTIARRPG